MRKSIFMIVLLPTLLIGCVSNAKKESVVKPEITGVKGDLNGCFEVVEKDYKIREDGINLVINIELKRTSKELPFNPFVGKFEYGTLDDGNGKRIKVGFGIEFLDENNDIIESIKAGESGWYGAETENISDLMKLNNNETGTLSIKVKGENNPVKFRILTNVNESIKEISTNESSSDTKNSSNQWDSVLDSYEKYIDQYIKLYKKAMAGDMSAMTEYASMLEKAEELSDKLENAEDNFTPKQLQRFAKLQEKMLSALQ